MIRKNIYAKWKKYSIISGRKRKITNAINKTYTLLDILEKYERVEIPIIQRDYAQGRKEVENIREKFLDYIIAPLAGSGNVELDFVYGYTYPANVDETNEKNAVFFPVDGQQRLTTLWLLHWYLAFKAKQLPRLLPKLKKFTYETRPSSRNFLEQLCKKDNFDKLKIDKPLVQQIKDETAWFADSWNHDVSITSFLTMLDAIQYHEKINKHNAQQLLNRLINGKAVTFYFLSLKDFSLGEEIYLRMNARGKILNDFENFKSCLFEITSQHSAHNDLTKKIDNDWVDILWKYRDNGYIVDSLLHKYILFIVKMLYIYPCQITSAQGGAPAPNNLASVDFSDFHIVDVIFSKEENLEFLIRSFDRLPLLENLSPDIDFEWEDKRGLSEQLMQIIKPKGNKPAAPACEIYVYAALLFLEKYPPENDLPLRGINDFLRVVRNLFGNTPDRSLNTWPRILKAIDTLISDGWWPYDVYEVLANINEKNLPGFRDEQVKMEIIKAKLIKLYPGCKIVLADMDEHKYLRGKIGSLLGVSLKLNINSKTDINSIDLANVDIKDLQDIFSAYKKLEKWEGERFEGIRGELLTSSMYKVAWGCCVYPYGCDQYNSEYVHTDLLELVNSLKNVPDIIAALIVREKEFIRALDSKYRFNFCEIEDPKEQLYLLYIYTLRILNKSWKGFYRNRNSKGFNFAWLPAKDNYCTPFIKTGNIPNAIFQVYSSRFMNRDDIIDWRTPLAQTEIDTRDFVTDFAVSIIEFCYLNR